MVELEIFAKLLLALVIGLIIGLEREKAHKPAGLRTITLICFGSALITSTALNYFDPDSAARIIANVIVGIGFIGAGTILVVRNQVIGLTTAATIWVSAILGIVIGLGLYLIAIFSTILIIFVLFVLRKLI